MGGRTNIILISDIPFPEYIAPKDKALTWEESDIKILKDFDKEMVELVLRKNSEGSAKSYT